MKTNLFTLKFQCPVPSGHAQRRLGFLGISRMHRRLCWERTIATACWLCLAAVTRSQTHYAMNWFTTDGGGGTSAGGGFTLHGTIGQPDAGKLNVGPYTLHGGFWSVVAAVQTPGAPLLSIARTVHNTVAVSWPSPSTGYVLQQNSDLTTTNWVDVAQAPSDNGTTKTVIVNLPTGKMFYRLKKP